MLLLLSPSKKLDESKIDLPNDILSKPVFADEVQQLVEIMQGYSAFDIAKLMHVSDNIANLNHQRFAKFGDKSSSKPTLYLFKGDVYDAMDIASYDSSELEFANSHLRILSGLYGLLKPCDLMQPYRLEMGTKLATEQGKNLYAFWGDKITHAVNDALESSGSNVLINLASNEYFKAVKPKQVAGEIINIDFKEYKNGQYKTIGIFAKKARGMMADFIIKNKITKPEILKDFAIAGYGFNENMSTGSKLTFTRNQEQERAA